MAFDVRTTLGAIAGYLEGSGHVKGISLGEPKAPPAGDIHAAVFMSSVRLAGFYVNGGTKEIHVVQVRLYKNMLADNAKNEELLAEAISQISSDLLGDFDLGATIRNIDGAGEHGQGMTATWGYVTIGDTMYRIVDLLVPCIVDDSATAAA